MKYLESQNVKVTYIAISYLILIILKFPKESFNNIHNIDTFKFSLELGGLNLATSDRRRVKNAIIFPAILEIFSVIIFIILNVSKKMLGILPLRKY